MVIPSTAKALGAVVRPEILIRALLKRFQLGSFDFRLAFDAFDRPWYAHGIYEAARLAALLRQPGITIIEFGVAHGSGLVAMERIAAEVRNNLGLQIDIVGFDNAEGLPSQRDYRDLPCVWKRGLYKMDVDAVRARLSTARLMLGDVGQTVPAFLKAGGFPPIGFISFDLDYYTSTRDALRIFNGTDESCLPRVFSYFDDILSGDQQYYCEDVGELLAVREFNENPSRNHRLRPINGWKRSHLLEPEWADAMLLYHRFDHPQYNEFIGDRLPVAAVRAAGH